MTARPPVPTALEDVSFPHRIRVDFDEANRMFVSCDCMRQADGRHAPLAGPGDTPITDQIAAYTAHLAEVSGS